MTHEARPGDQRSAALAAASSAARLPLVHTLPPSHSDYGGERMTLTILDGLREYFDVYLLADPELQVHQRARDMGISTVPVTSRIGLIRKLANILRRNRQLVFMTSDVQHSAIMAGLNAVFRRQVAHIHIGHGGPEPAAYHHKKLLNRIPGLRFAAVSAYSRSRLEAYGVRSDRISVIHNFLPPARQKQLQELAADRSYEDVRRVVMLGHVEELKRFDLIFAAIDQEPELRQVEFRVLGDGPLLEQMRERANSYPNVTFLGFTEEIAPELAEADLFLHCCPVEAFALVVLEAAAAGLPGLVPDAGGASDIVIAGQTGLRFRANDPSDMARQLLVLLNPTPSRRRSLASAAVAHLESEYQQQARVDDYRDLIESLLTRKSRPASVGA